MHRDDRRLDRHPGTTCGHVDGRHRITATGARDGIRTHTHLAVKGGLRASSNVQPVPLVPESPGHSLAGVQRVPSERSIPMRARDSCAGIVQDGYLSDNHQRTEPDRHHFDHRVRRTKVARYGRSGGTQSAGTRSAVRRWVSAWTDARRSSLSNIDDVTSKLATPRRWRRRTASRSAVPGSSSASPRTSTTSNSIVLRGSCVR